MLIVAWRFILLLVVLNAIALVAYLKARSYYRKMLIMARLIPHAYVWPGPMRHFRQPYYPCAICRGDEFDGIHRRAAQ